MIAIGVTSLFFEIKDFEFINYRYDNNENSTHVQNTTFTDKNPVLDIDDGLGYEWKNDNTMKDGEVRVETISNIHVSIHKNRMKIEYNEKTPFYGNEQHIDGWEAFNFFLDGLKNHKVYVADNFSSVRLTSNATTRNSFTIQYDN